MIKAAHYCGPQLDCNGKCGVTIQLPIFNERYVAKRVIEACIKMTNRYREDCVQILVLDDSLDDTVGIVKETVEKYRGLGYDIQVIHRSKRDGFKAGALQNALSFTKHPFICIFDADFVPREEFLERVMPQFEDPKIAVVQCRWGHINRNYNSITKAIAIGYDGHMWFEQSGRYVGGYLLNFNGSAGIIRREALEQAGGWHSDTLAEDLDVSYRMQLIGWKIVFLRDLECPAEVPPTFLALKRQQNRWASGSMRAFRKLFGRVLGNKELSTRQKLEAFIHLSNYAVHPLMLIVFAIAVIVPFLDIPVGLIGYIFFLHRTFWDYLIAKPYWIVLNIANFFRAILMWIIYAKTLRIQGLKVRDNLQALTNLGLIGFGLSLSNTLAALRGILGKSGGFLRTPKYRIEKSSDTWRDKVYKISFDKTAFAESILGITGIVAMFEAMIKLNVGPIPILLYYTVAYLSVVRMTICEGITTS